MYGEKKQRQKTGIFLVILTEHWGMFRSKSGVKQLAKTRPVHMVRISNSVITKTLCGKS